MQALLSTPIKDLLRSTRAPAEAVHHAVTCNTVSVCATRKEAVGNTQLAAIAGIGSRAGAFTIFSANDGLVADGVAAAEVLAGRFDAFRVRAHVGAGAVCVKLAEGGLDARDAGERRGSAGRRADYDAHFAVAAR